MNGLLKTFGQRHNAIGMWRAWTLGCWVGWWTLWTDDEESDTADVPTRQMWTQSDQDGILSLSIWLLQRIQPDGHIIKVQSYKLYGLEDTCDTKHWIILYEPQISFTWIDGCFRRYKQAFRSSR